MENTNQVPLMTGATIPEPVFTPEEYQTKTLDYLLEIV